MEKVECTYLQLIQAVNAYNLANQSNVRVEIEDTKLGQDHNPKFTVAVSLYYGDDLMNVFYGTATKKLRASTKAATAAKEQLYALAFDRARAAKAAVKKPAPTPISSVVSQMSAVVSSVRDEARKAHLLVLFAHKATTALSALKTVPLDYGVVAKILIDVISAAGSEQEAEAHNKLMHALNGNGLRADLHSVIDKSMDEAQGLSFEARQNLILRAVKSQFGKKKQSTRKPRKGDNKKANRAVHSKNGNELAAHEAVHVPQDAPKFVSREQLGIGARHMTLGSSGSVPLRMYKVSEFPIQADVEGYAPDFARTYHGCLLCDFNSDDCHEEDCLVASDDPCPNWAALDRLYNTQISVYAEALKHAYLKKVEQLEREAVREIEANEHNSLMHATNGNAIFDKAALALALRSLDDGWCDLDPASAAKAVNHNATMHATNGNEMTTMTPTAMVSGRRSEEYTKALSNFAVDCKRDGLSEAANKALLQMLDPCADVDREAVDVPTGLIDPILVTRVVQEIPIGRPTTIAADATWDLHVCTDQFSGGAGAHGPGFMSSTELCGVTATSAGQDVYTASPTNTSSRGAFVGEPIIIHRRQTSAGGEDWFPSNGTLLTGASGDIGCVPIPQLYTKNPYRVVGVGFELVNTTAVLYISGSATCYEFPARMQDQVRNFIANWIVGIQVLGASNLAVLGSTDAAVWTHQDARMISVARPPKTLADATNAKGSRTWPAAKGYYAPATFEALMEVSNPVPFVPGWYEDAQNEGLPSASSTVQCLFPGRGIPNGQSTFVNQLISSQESTGNTSIGGTVSSPFQWNGNVGNYRYVPTSRKGVIFSGLSYQTTFTLRVVYYLTRVPQVAQLDLYTMAHKAPGFDPYFWAAYKYCQETMPIACTFDENPLGEWFNTVTKFLAKAGPVVGNLIPGGSGIGKIVGDVARGANRWNRGKEVFHKKPKKS